VGKTVKMTRYNLPPGIRCWGTTATIVGEKPYVMRGQVGIETRITHLGDSRVASVG
jgi:hypothetical protein